MCDLKPFSKIRLCNLDIRTYIHEITCAVLVKFLGSVLPTYAINSIDVL